MNKLIPLLAFSILLLIPVGIHDSFSEAFPGFNGKIAFSSNTDGDFEIYVMNADGTGVIQLTSNDDVIDVEPSWSPDGTKIAFASDRDHLLREIYVMNADGTGVTRLTDNAVTDSQPS